MTLISPIAMAQGRRSRFRLVPALLLALSLGGCVTETTGGFNVDQSDEQALRNYIQLAVGYLDEGDLRNTKRHLANAEGIDPTNSEVEAIWGLVYAREGEVSLADESFRRALRLDSGNSQARNNYSAFLFANGDYEEAYEQLELVVEDTAYAARAQAFENLGFAALRLNRSDDAAYAFGRALQLNDRQVRSSLELAAIYLQRNDAAQARTFFRNYTTLMQLYSIGHNPRSLWIGAQLEHALGNETNMLEYGNLLEANFSASQEYRLYQQLLDTTENESDD